MKTFGNYLEDIHAKHINLHNILSSILSDSNIEDIKKLYARKEGTSGTSQVDLGKFEESYPNTVKVIIEDLKRLIYIKRRVKKPADIEKDIDKAIEKLEELIKFFDKKKARLQFISDIDKLFENLNPDDDNFERRFQHIFA